jgi:hypothetical protein
MWPKVAHIDFEAERMPKRFLEEWRGMLACTGA